MSKKYKRPEPDPSLEEVEQTVCELTHKKAFPCWFTPEELNSRAAKAIEDYERGEYISHKEMKKKFST
ncbi:MAG: hypothetical protein LUE93_08005 [Bacteroides sp.]|nr:hypothetical protein [Bacteroides sp.]